MSESAMTPAHRFTVGGALGFGFEVLRARPGAVGFLLVFQTLVYAVIMVAQFGLIGHFAREGVMLADAGDTAGAFVVNMRLSAVSSLFSLLTAPFWLWLEAVWLVLFMRGHVTFWPGWGNLGRMTLGFMILFGVYIGAVIILTVVMALAIVILSLIAEGGGDPRVLVSIGVLLGLAMFVLMMAGLALFSALPAHGVTGRFEIGQAIRTAWRHMGGLVFAWLVFGVLYLVVISVCYGLLALGFLDEIRAMMDSFIKQPEDPLIAMRFYAWVIPQTQDLPLMMLVMAPIMLIMGVLMMIGRGISAKLALSMPDPEKKAD